MTGFRAVSRGNACGIRRLLRRARSAALCPDTGFQVVHLPLERRLGLFQLRLERGGLRQLLRRVLHLILEGGNLFVQAGLVRAVCARCAGLQRVALPHQLFFFRLGCVALLGERRDVHVLRPVQLLFQRVQLLFHGLDQFYQLRRRALLVFVHVQQLLQLIRAGLGSVALFDQFSALLFQLFNGRIQPRGAFVDVADRAVDPAQYGLFLARQLLFALAQLGLGVVQLDLRVGQLRVDIPQDGAVQRVDARLFDGDVDLLLDQTGGVG